LAKGGSNGNESEDSLDREADLGGGISGYDAADDGPDEFVLGDDDSMHLVAHQVAAFGSTGGSMSNGDQDTKGGIGSRADAEASSRPSWLMEEGTGTGSGIGAGRGEQSTRTHRSGSFVTSDDTTGRLAGAAGTRAMGSGSELSHGKPVGDGCSEDDGSRSIRGSVQDQRSIESLATVDRQPVLDLRGRSRRAGGRRRSTESGGAEIEAGDTYGVGGRAEAGDPGGLGSTGGLDEMPSIVSVTSVRTNDSDRQGRHAMVEGGNQGHGRRGRDRVKQRPRGGHAHQNSNSTDSGRIELVGLLKHGGMSRRNDSLPRLRIGVGPAGPSDDGRRSAASPVRGHRTVG